MKVCTEIRANQLGIKDCFFGVKDKYKRLKDFQKEKRISIAKCAYVGDDVNDIVVRPLVSLFICLLMLLILKIYFRF